MNLSFAEVATDAAKYIKPRVMRPLYHRHRHIAFNRRTK